MLSSLRQLHPNVRVRLVTTFLGKVTGTTVVPFLGLLFAREHGPAVAGLMLGAGYVLQFLVGLYGGAVSDTLGRKRVMVWGEAAKVAAFGVMLVAALTGAGSGWIFAATLVLALGNGLASPAGEAMLVDVSTPQSRAFIYAVNYWGNNLGYLLGVPLGGLLFRDHLPVLLGLLVAVSAVILWVTATRIQESWKPRPGARGAGAVGLGQLLGSYRLVARDRAFLVLTLSGVLVLTVEFARTTFIAVRLDHDLVNAVASVPGLGAVAFDGARALSLITVVNTLMIVLGTAPVARFVTGRDPRRWMIVGFGLFGLGYAAAMLLSAPLALVLAALVFSVGELLYVPTRQAVVADMVPAERRGAYLAVNGLVFQLGKWLAALGLMLWPVLGNVGMAALLLTLAVAGSVLGWSATRRLPEAGRVGEVAS